MLADVIALFQFVQIKELDVDEYVDVVVVMMPLFHITQIELLVVMVDDVEDMR